MSRYAPPPPPPPGSMFDGQSVNLPTRAITSALNPAGPVLKSNLARIEQGPYRSWRVSVGTSIVRMADTTTDLPPRNPQQWVEVVAGTLSGTKRTYYLDTNQSFVVSGTALEVYALQGTLFADNIEGRRQYYWRYECTVSETTATPVSGTTASQPHCTFLGCQGNYLSGPYPFAVVAPIGIAAPTTGLPLPVPPNAQTVDLISGWSPGDIINPPTGGNGTIWWYGDQPVTGNPITEALAGTLILEGIPTPRIVPSGARWWRFDPGVATPRIWFLHFAILI